MSERSPIDPLTRAAVWCLGLMLLAVGLTAARAVRAASQFPDRAEITLAFRGDGRLDRATAGRPGGVVGDLDARPLVLDPGAEIEVATGALRVVGHDDAGRLLLFARTDGLLETGPLGETVYYVATDTGRHARLLIRDKSQP